MTTPKVSVSDVRCTFRGPHRGEQIRAVDGVSLEIAPGECLGLVGESGSGKSTLGRCIAGLQQVTSGTVDVSSAEAGQPVRSRGRVQMVFQDPYDALNPRMRVADIVLEPLRLASPKASRGSMEEQARRLLGRVHLGEEFLRRRPHELSGGQRQRVGVARALAAEPELVIFDEPTSALDWMTRGELLELINEIRGAGRLSCLFISHDLSAVARVSDRVAVMYLGRIVEVGPRDRVLEHPEHPYTQALLSAVLDTDVQAAADRLHSVR